MNMKRAFVIISFALLLESGVEEAEAGLEDAISMESEGPQFVSDPRSPLEFSNRTGGVLHCPVRGSPPPRVTWLTGDGAVAAPIRNVRELLTNGSLFFPAFGPESYRHDVHSAVYRCEAANTVGKILSKDILVRAVVEQNYDVQVHDAYVTVGNTAVLRCVVPTFVKDFLTVTSWVQDSSFNIYPSIQDTDSKYRMLPTGELLVYTVTEADSEVSYRCRVVHRITGRTTESSSQGRIFVTDGDKSEAPKINERIPQITVHAGDLAVLSCTSQGVPPPSYWWIRNRKENNLAEEISSLSNDRYRLQGGIFIIQNVEEEDAGNYACTVNNTAGSDRIHIELVVISQLTAHLSPPVITVDIGHSVEFTCTVSGHSPHIISWFKDGLPLQDHGRHIQSSAPKGSILTIQSVTRDSRGMYQCFVRNDFGNTQASAELKLGDATPQIIYKFIEQTIQPGPSVSLKCIATGNPTPQFTWKLDGFPLPQNERILMGQYVTLNGDVVSHINISSVLVEDGGEYTCEATNSVGSLFHSARLNIYGMPRIRSMPKITAVSGQDLVVKCPVGGFPITTITWKKDNHLLPLNRRQDVSPEGKLTIRNIDRQSDKGTYSCTASNKQGQEDSKSVVIEIKVPPKIDPFSFPESVQAGSRVHVTCVVSEGDSPIQLEWLKDGHPLDISNGRTHKISAFDLALIISNARPEHNGNYTCFAFNEAARTSRSAQLLVHVPPTWQVEPQDQQAPEGVSQFLIHCQAEGFPKPSITWRKAVGNKPGKYHDIQMLAKDTDSKVQSSFHYRTNGSLIIYKPQEEHEGFYLCEAYNGIGAGLSKVIYFKVNAPVRMVTKYRNVTTKLGSSVTLKCEVHGDHPITILWEKSDYTLSLSMNDYRYAVKESNTTDGLSSELKISAASRQDSGQFYCIATNQFGRDDMVVHLTVQEPPDFPRNLHVLEKGSRFVRLSWSSSSSQNNQVAQYIIEYKLENGPWREQSPSLSTSGSETELQISNLKPATNYQFRIFSENESGRSQASDVLDVMTNGDIPEGPPLEVKVEAISSTQLKVSWLPPEKHLWNGEILGYHIGYKEKKLYFDVYQHKRVEMSLENYSYSTTLNNLKKFTHYIIVIQAFNYLGQGPESEEVEAKTFEDVPSAAPDNIRCTPLSSESLQITWNALPEGFVHGVLRGYKVIWENVNENGDEIQTETKITTQTIIVIHGLGKFTNHSIQVGAFTQVGDGVFSSPLYCATEEDVPEAPADLKPVINSSSSIILSWLKPSKTNGVLTLYNLYIESLTQGSEIKSFRRTLPPENTWYEAEGLSKTNRYQFSVAAGTKIGEGPRSKVVSASPSAEVGAAIFSFGATIIISWRQDVHLQCQHVGKPLPIVTWKKWGQPLKYSSRFKLGLDSSLHITNVSRDDSGNFSCHIENPFSLDYISHRLVVKVVPASPLLHVTSSTNTSLHIQWKQSDDGGSPIRSFTIHYKSEPGKWTDLKVDRHLSSYILTNLSCGTMYRIYVTSQNKVGSSEPSQEVVISTNGSKPSPPPQDRFIFTNSSSAILFLENWVDSGCPILYFDMEYKKVTDKKWTLVSNNIVLQRMFFIQGLPTGTDYQLRVKAQNSAGLTTAEYHMRISNEVGGTFSPTLGRINDSISPLADAEILISAALFSVIIFSFMSLLFICYKRGCKREGAPQTYASHTFSSNTNEKKQHMKMQDQYFTTVRKHSFSSDREISTFEQIPEYSEDIYPYATFHLNKPAEARIKSDASLQTFTYHDPHFTSAETLKIKENNYPSVKNLLHKMKSLKSESEEYDESESESEHTISGQVESGFRSKQSFNRFHRNRLHKLVSKRDHFDSSPGQKRILSCHKPMSKGQKLSSNAQLDPPSEFSDTRESSEAERNLFMNQRRLADFTIAV
ncbi:unnamed protein product [Bemisia tabaci]|uniref:Down syndrome cell adhesion molecule-like protein Dscam2 n=2 Tax=Bemisia tabaci TaxID=7038 RepID=A0A9P0G3G0_BEMTA|nr:unnamed protein product [Bemisia tabaci]